MSGTPPAASAADEPFTLPNGEVIFHRHRYETDFLYREIFLQRIYARNGITLPARARVVDVGANIGLFSLFVKLECSSAQLYSFEPAPELFRLAQRNLARFGADVRLFPVGLSDCEKKLEFTYYPGYSILSGFHATPAQDREVLATGVKNQLQSAAPHRTVPAQNMIDALVGKKLEGAERYECPLISFSDFLRNERLEAVDLLKVDAERCELEIFAGIADHDWSKIRQLVVEAHDCATAVELERMLLQRGFQVVVEQESQFEDSGIMNLYARRRES